MRHVKTNILAGTFFGVFSMAASRSLAGEVPMAKACEDLNAEVGLSVIASDYSSWRSTVMSPCFFSRNIQFGLTYGLVEFPYVGDDEWELVMGREILFGFSVRQDFARSEDYASGVKVDFNLGTLKVESQKVKDKALEEVKVNSIRTSDLTIGVYSTYKSWESNIGIVQKTFSTDKVYSIKGEVLPLRDFGIKYSLAYLIK